MSLAAVLSFGSIAKIIPGSPPLPNGSATSIHYVWGLCSIFLSSRCYITREHEPPPSHLELLLLLRLLLVLRDLVLEGGAPLDDGDQATLVLSDQQDRRLQRLRPRPSLKAGERGFVV